MKDWKKKLKLRLPALLLLLATLLFWSRYERYEAAGPLLLESPPMAAATRVRGECTETNGHFIRTVPVSGKTASINFRMPNAAGYEFIRVHGRIKVENVVEGKNYWRCARLLLVQYDGNNKWIPGHHGVVAEQGSKDWEFHEDVFEIDSLAAHVDLVIQQTGLSGIAEFDQLRVEPLRLRASFVWWRTLFFVLWLLAAVLYFPRCRLHRRKLKVLILLNAMVILAGTLMPGVWIQDSTARFKTAVQELRAPEPVPEQEQTSKKKPASPQEQIDWFVEIEVEAHQVGHFTLFASLCFLVYLSAALERQHPAYFFKVGIDVLLFAAITESLQFLTLDRTAGILDLRTDLYGMALAFVVFLAVRPLVLKRA